MRIALALALALALTLAGCASPARESTRGGGGGGAGPTCSGNVCSAPVVVEGNSTDPSNASNTSS